MEYQLILKKKSELDISEIERIIRDDNNLDEEWDIELNLGGSYLEWTATKNISADIDDDTLILHALETNQLSQEDFDDSEIEVE